RVRDGHPDRRRGHRHGGQGAGDASVPGRGGRGGAHHDRRGAAPPVRPVAGRGGPMNGPPPAPAAVNPQPRRRFVESVWAVLTHPFFLVTVGGAVGSLLRYVVGRWVDARLTAGGLPWGTFVVNVTGSFILGVLGLWVLGRLPPHYRGVSLLFG